MSSSAPPKRQATKKSFELTKIFSNKAKIVCNGIEVEAYNILHFMCKYLQGQETQKNRNWDNPKTLAKFLENEARFLLTN